MQAAARRYSSVALLAGERMAVRREIASEPIGGEGVAAAATPVVDVDLGTLNGGHFVTTTFDVTVNAGAVAAGQVCKPGHSVRQQLLERVHRPSGHLRPLLAPSPAHSRRRHLRLWYHWRHARETILAGKSNGGPAERFSLKTRVE